MAGISIAALAGGAVQERFEYELNKVLENIADMNTRAKTKRKLTLTLTFEANEKRDDISVDIQSKISVAPIKPLETRFYLDKDIKTNTVKAQEARSGEMKNQIKLEEVVSENEETESGKLVKFNSK